MQELIKAAKPFEYKKYEHTDKYRHGDCILIFLQCKITFKLKYDY
jgi:hypothetical protein